MRRLVADMNPTLRGFILIALVSALIVGLQAETVLVQLSVVLQIAFLLALAYVVYVVWRGRRSEIAAWPVRAQASFYGAAALVVADIGAYWYVRPRGLDALAFFLVLGACVFALFRIWRDEHTYV